MMLVLGDVATQSDALTQIILGVLTLAILAVGAVFAGLMARRARETSEAVHDTDGTSIVEMFRRRLDNIDDRIDRNANRINQLEGGVAEAHRRIDRLDRRPHPTQEN